MNKVLRDPINIIIVWWSGWALIASFSLTGLFPPSLFTYGLVFAFLASMFLGSQLAYKTIAKREIKKIYLKNKLHRLLGLAYKISYWFFFCILFILVVRCIYLIFTSDSPTLYRATAFSSSERAGQLFRNRLAENLYFFASSPFLYFATLVGLVDFWKGKNLSRLYHALILNGMDSFIRLARVNLYMIVIMIVVVFLLSENEFWDFVKRKKVQLFWVIVPTAICIFSVGVLREYNFLQQLKMFIIDYHTVGFSLFDKQLTDPSSLLNTSLTYGRLTLGGAETVITLFIRVFNRSYYSPALLNSINMSSISDFVGVEIPPSGVFNGIKVYNSFYTLLYTFYSDGRFLGIVLGGGSLGFSLRYFHLRWLKTNSTLDALCVIHLLLICILSLFVSQLEIMRTWIVFAVIFTIFVIQNSRFVND